GPRVFDGETIRSGVAVVIEGARIAAVVDERELDARVSRRKMDGGLLAPGFIDVQVNGGAGTLFNADPSAAAVACLAKSHRRFGTTGLLPTVITDRPENLARAIAAVRDARAAGVPLEYESATRWYDLGHI